MSDPSAEEAIGWLETLFGQLGCQASVLAMPGGEAWTFRVEPGPDTEILIGPKGQTLDALQYLLNAAYMQPLGKRLVLDVGGYREQRLQKLIESAHDAADRVRLTAKVYKFPPMGSADRKIVHTVLTEYTDLTTQSEGEDPYRYVVLSPFGRRGGPNPQPQGRPARDGSSARPAPSAKARSRRR